jgi:N-acetyl-anhydromuramyl-L-alanine amidase AmpD
MTYPIIELGGTWANGGAFPEPPIGIVIHSMSEYLEGLHAPIWLRDKRKLSAHCFISPEGGRHLGLTPDRIAYHAGKGKHHNEARLNSRFLGIEILLKGTNNWPEPFKTNIHKPDAYTEAQHESAAIHCASLMAKIPSINPNNILGHSDVSGRQFREDYKVDPGQGWSWYKFFSYLGKFS